MVGNGEDSEAIMTFTMFIICFEISAGTRRHAASASESGLTRRRAYRSLQGSSFS